MFTPLEAREAFHLLLLRELVRSLPVDGFALKGGSNLRFFFGSVRYSEDMDIDIRDDIPVHSLQERVLAALHSPALRAGLSAGGVREIVAPDMARAKQTETVQRFKVHLLTAAEDLFTKAEFSRRGFDGAPVAEEVDAAILRRYRMPPLIVPHYPASAAARQKLRALVSRARPQARDVFDLWVLSTRTGLGDLRSDVDGMELPAVRERIYAIDYHDYRDGVVSFLPPAEQAAYGSPGFWDEIRLGLLTALEPSG